MNKKTLFFSLTGLIMITFSFLAFDPSEVVIIGPEFHEQEYFIEELNIIADELGIKIKYESVSDAETFIIDNPNSSSSIAIIPNPQGVVNLAERQLIYSLDDVLVDDKLISNLYPNHLISIVSHEDSIYGGWTRLFPNSLIWYDISKFEQHNITFDSFDTLLKDTKKIADKGISPWCANSESSASTGWVQTNWMEDVLLTKYGPKVYDEWSKLEINASNIKIFLSIKQIEEFIFYDNHIHNGPGSIISKEFRNLPKVLLDDSTECFMSWSGHYFRYYIPEDYKYLKDYAVTNVPKINFENSVVGIGDNIVLIKDNELSKKVISKILSKNFGETWSSYQDTEFISANQKFNKQIINNELTKYEYSIVHDALQKDLFRYDASEIMARPIGSNLLWKLFKEYIKEGPQNLVKLLNELDREI
ncbi:MAG: extracellular solute-binding protein [Candidatus Neomarinimicrobiota bacterium]